MTLQQQSNLNYNRPGVGPDPVSGLEGYVDIFASAANESLARFAALEGGGLEDNLVYGAFVGNISGDYQIQPADAMISCLSATVDGLTVKLPIANDPVVPVVLGKPWQVYNNGTRAFNVATSDGAIVLIGLAPGEVANGVPFDRSSSVGLWAISRWFKGTTAAALLQGKHAIDLPASAFIEDVEGTVPLVTELQLTNTVMSEFLSFNPSFSAAAQTSQALPRSVKPGSAFTGRVFMGQDPGAGGTVDLATQLSITANGVAIDLPFSGPEVATPTTSQGNLTIMEFNAGIVPTGVRASHVPAVLNVRIFRNVPTDTLPVNARLYRLQLDFDIDRGNDSA